MYIPFWLIIVGAIAAIYFFSKSKRESSTNIPAKSMPNFSYKLDIYLEPWWYKIYKKISNPADEKLWDKETKKKIDNFEKSKDMDSNLYGRRYLFTEYYDSASGLITRFQKVRFWSGEQKFYPVDEFGDRGYIFDEDSSMNASLDETDDARERREQLCVEIGENFIRNDIYDKHIGGPRLEIDYEKENYIFSFPLYEVFNFLFALGTRFHDTEKNRIIKWPDQIEKSFEEHGIRYETQFVYEPEEFDIKKHDADFYEKWGKPKVCLYSSDRSSSSYIKGKEDTHYSVTLQIFRPGENDRIGNQ
jgi:hypothetical protein